MFESYVSRQALERLVQSVAQFSRINGPNENSGGGGRREGGGLGILNIPLTLSCVPNPRLLHSNILCSVQCFSTIWWSAPPAALCSPTSRAPAGCPLCYFKASFLTTRICGNCRPFLCSVVLALCFNCHSLAVAYVFHFPFPFYFSTNHRKDKKKNEKKNPMHYKFMIT